jgi:hypothetical protein
MALAARYTCCIAAKSGGKAPLRVRSCRGAVKVGVRFTTESCRGCRRPACLLWAAGSTGQCNTLLILLVATVCIWRGKHEHGYTPKQRAELWECWKSGQCVADVARAEKPLD